MNRIPFFAVILAGFSFAASCGNLMDARSCARECNTNHDRCLSGLVLLNVPGTQSLVVNTGMLLSCETDKTSCEQRCYQAPGE